MIPRTDSYSRTYSALLPFPCFYLPHEVARVLEDGPGASASTNTRLSSSSSSTFSSSRAIHLYARGEIISVTRNTPAVAAATAGKLLVLEHRHVQILYIFDVHYFGVSRGNVFGEARLLYRNIESIESNNRGRK